MAGRRAAGAVLAAVVWASAPAPVAAQDAPAPPAPGTVQVLSRATFHLGAEKLFSSDRRFRWLVGIGFDLDVVDFGTGRVTLRGDYEAVEGRERRRFDLNQGTYVFELSGTRRLGDVELSVFEQHVSRHLVDRENPPAISWNTLGGRVRYEGRAGVTVELEIGRPWDLALVDYRLVSRLHLAYERPVGSGVTLLAAATGHAVDGRADDRRKSTGGRLQAGLRLAGGAADLELLASYERRLDAWPTTRGRERWFGIGFRVVSKPSR